MSSMPGVVGGNSSIYPPIPETEIHLHDVDDFNLLVAVAIVDLRRYPGTSFPSGLPWITVAHAYPTREYRWKAYSATESEAMESAVRCGLITSGQADFRKLHLGIESGKVLTYSNYLRDPGATLSAFEAYRGEPIAWDLEPAILALVTSTDSVN